MSKLDSSIAASKCRYHALYFIATNDTQLNSSTTDNNDMLKLSLLHRKHEWLNVEEDSKVGEKKFGGARESTGKLNISSIPPAFTPIPCTPLFFDVALNSITVSEAIDIRSGAKKAAKPQSDSSSSGGIVGTAQSWLGGWFSSGK
jgi:hypothetical protein